MGSSYTCVVVCSFVINKFGVYVLGRFEFWNLVSCMCMMVGGGGVKGRLGLSP